MVDIDMVVVNYKTYGLMRKFLRTLEKYPPQTTEWNLAVVDNESDLDQLHCLKDSFIAHSYYGLDTNVGYARACNFGASLGEAKYIALLNSDLEFVNSTCVDMCVQFLEDNPDVGIVGPLQYTTQQGGGRKITHAGIFGPGSQPKHRGWLAAWDGKRFTDNSECLMISGSAMFIRREAWNAVMEDGVFRKHYPNALGAMPEHPLYYEDTALCYAMPKFGYKVYVCGEPGFELIHQWHKTIGSSGETTHFKTSQRMFRELMDDWGIEHD